MMFGECSDKEFDDGMNDLMKVTEPEITGSAPVPHKSGLSASSISWAKKLFILYDKDQSGDMSN